MGLDNGVRAAAAMALGVLAFACGSSNGTGTSGAGGSTSSATQSTSSSQSSGATMSSTSGTATSGTGGASSSSGATTGTGGSSSGSGGGGSGGDIGQWTDAPGACPPNVPQVDLTTGAEIASASRGEDAYTGDAPNTCYLIHNGTYATSGVVLYIKKGGDPNGGRRMFIGESRSGVVIVGRASTDDGVSDVTLSNFTIDLTGYSQSGSFNTISLGNGKNLTVDHMTLTGDCATGANGGHIETNGSQGVLVEACVIEKFGRCSGGQGHQDHGIYLASGSDITIRNNVIRGNSSRGIQMYTADGAYGTLDTILVERNRITQNGHGDYEDGIVINAGGTGTIKKVTIQRNILDHNYYSGVRFVSGAMSSVSITRNTFASNGAGSSSANRSEVNLDDVGGGAGTSLDTNIFDIGNVLINDCYDASSLGFGFGANLTHGTVPSGAQGSCIGMQTSGDPQFKDAANGDYHPMNPAAMAFGAYAP